MILSSLIVKYEAKGKPRASGDDPVAIVPIEFGIM